MVFTRITQRLRQNLRTRVLGHPAEKIESQKLATSVEIQKGMFQLTASHTSDTFPAHANALARHLPVVLDEHVTSATLALLAPRLPTFHHTSFPPAAADALETTLPGVADFDANTHAVTHATVAVRLGRSAT